MNIKAQTQPYSEQWFEEKLMQFDRLSAGNAAPGIQDFIEQCKQELPSGIWPHGKRESMLLELIKVDMEYQWSAGHSKTGEQYLSRFPELPAGTLGELVESELEARVIAGLPPDHEELKSRFGKETDQWAQLLSSIQQRERRCRQRQIDTAGAKGIDTARSSAAGIPASRLQSGECIGHYKLEREIGRGAFACVWLAHDQQLDRKVAIKLIFSSRFGVDDSVLPRLLREARAVALIDHPGIVQVYEVSSDCDCPYIVEQFVDGHNLAERVDKAEIEETQAISWLIKVAEAAHSAHQCGIVHRDIKPANILVGSDGQPKLVDFGLALIDNQNEATLTREGDMLGTPAYMSPEQAMGQHHMVDCRTDVYSMGAVLFHLLTGRIPFEGSALSVLHDVVHKPPQMLFRDIRGVSRDLQTIVLRCLEKESPSRYPSAGELADDLRRYQAGEPIHARPAGWIERQAKWIRRKPKLAAMLLVLMLLSTTLLGSLFQLRNVKQQRDRADRLKSFAEQEVLQKTIHAGQLAMKRGRMLEAARHLSVVCQEDGTRDQSVWLDYVESLIAIRDVKNANSVMQKLTRQFPEATSAPEYHFIKAQLSLENRSFTEQSIASLHSALQQELDDCHRHYVEAMLATTSQQAIQKVRQALVAEPMHHQSHRMLCFLYFSLAQLDDLEQHLQQALLLFPDDVDFQLLECMRNACIGELETALEDLPEDVMSEQEGSAWNVVLEELHSICSDYSHFEGEAINFNVMAMAEITESYLQVIHPQLEARGFHFPPLVGARFAKLKQTLTQFAEGACDEDRLTPFVRDVLKVHPEASLLCWLAGKQISQGQVAEAQQSFYKATQSCGFVRGTEGTNWYGLFATTVALWQRGVDVDEQFATGIHAVREIEALPNIRDRIVDDGSRCRTVASFMVEAAKLKLVSESEVYVWLDAARDSAGFSEPVYFWMKAVVANRHGRYLDALDLLEQARQADPQFQEIGQVGYKGMRDGILAKMSKALGDSKTNQN